MTHLVLLTRGNLEHVEIFIKELHTRYLPMDIYNPVTKKMERRLQQMRVCPVQLWDISFPDEHKDAVLNTCLAGNSGAPVGTHSVKYKLGFAALQKALRLSPIPEYNKKGKLAMRPPEHIELIGIGTKDDYWIEPDGSHVSKDKKSKLATEGI